MSTEPAVYVISLRRAAERRAWMSAHLAARGFPGFAFIDGVEGAAIPATELAQVYDDARARRRAGRAFTRGEVGCAMSQVLACRRLLADGVPWALVLEDDVLLAEDVPAVLAAAAGWLDSPEPRVLHLGALTGFLLRSARPLAGEHRQVRVHRAWGAYGYAINRAAAEAVVAENTPVHLMADDWVAYRRARGIEVQGVDPYCIDAHELGAASHLEDDRAGRRKKERTTAFRLRSLGEKLARNALEYFWLRPRWGLGRHHPGKIAARVQAQQQEPVQKPERQPS